MRTCFSAEEKDYLLLLKGSVKGGAEGDLLLLEGGGGGHPLEGAECSKEEEVERWHQSTARGDWADTVADGAVVNGVGGGGRVSPGCRLRATPLVPGRERSLCAGSAVIDMLVDMHLDTPQVFRRIALGKAARIWPASRRNFSQVDPLVSQSPAGTITIK